MSIQNVVIFTSGIGIASGMSMIYIALLWLCVGVVVWLTVVVAFLTISLFALWCYFQAGILRSGEHDSSYSLLWLIEMLQSICCW